jgi:hypothetical protein
VRGRTSARAPALPYLKSSPEVGRLATCRLSPAHQDPEPDELSDWMCPKLILVDVRVTYDTTIREVRNRSLRGKTVV